MIKDFESLFKKTKKETLKENKAKGKKAETIAKMNYQIQGLNVKRTGKGHDFKVSYRDPLTGKLETEYHEIKSGNAKLSPLQKKTQCKMGKKKYKVNRPRIF